MSTGKIIILQHTIDVKPGIYSAGTIGSPDMYYNRNIERHNPWAHTYSHGETPKDKSNPEHPEFLEDTADE